MFPGDGQHLQRYARVLRCTEINTPFYRSHRTQTYERWAEQMPPDFHFSVKLPRSITQEARLRTTKAPLLVFLAEVAGLGARLRVLLVQLLPSLPFEARQARHFFDLQAETYGGAVMLEPRHLSWFTPAADQLLISARVSRAAADPALCPTAAHPGGWLGSARLGLAKTKTETYDAAPFSITAGTVRRACTGLLMPGSGYRRELRKCATNGRPGPTIGASSTTRLEAVHCWMP